MLFAIKNKFMLKMKYDIEINSSTAPSIVTTNQILRKILFSQNYILLKQIQPAKVKLQLRRIDVKVLCFLLYTTSILDPYYTFICLLQKSHEKSVEHSINYM